MHLMTGENSQININELGEAIRVWAPSHVNCHVMDGAGRLPDQMNSGSMECRPGRLH